VYQIDLRNSTKLGSPAQQFVAALFIILTFSTLASAEPRLALVVGNADYRNVTPLKNPINDAMLVRQALVTFGYDVDFITNATGSQFKAGFAAFVEKRKAAGKGASTVVYFAGHGIQVDGMNYLLPVDADMTTPSDVKRDAHNVGEMAEALD